MPTDITEHPDAPDLEALGEFVVEPVRREEIERRRESGETLIEDNLVEREDLDDVHVGLDRQSRGREHVQDIGNYLYRYTQLFGTPQFPEYLAGEDISWRTNETFKYLLRISAPEDSDLPDNWLVTVFDWKVRLGVAVAEWRADEEADLDVGRDQALASLKLIHNVGSERVQCEYEDVWY